MAWKAEFECGITRFFRDTCQNIVTHCQSLVSLLFASFLHHTMRGLRCAHVDVPASSTSSSLTPQPPGKQVPLDHPLALSVHIPAMWFFLRGLNPGKRPAKALTVNVGTVYKKEWCGKCSSRHIYLVLWPHCLCRSYGWKRASMRLLEKQKSLLPVHGWY